MAYLKMHDVIDLLASMGKPVFTINDIAKVTGKPKAYLSRLLPTNSRIARIERGKYFIKGSAAMEIASNIIYPSYISMMSAFRYYDITTQALSKTTVITIRHHKSLSVNGERIEFRQIGRERMFGYKHVKGVMVATPEKAIIDALYVGEPTYSYVEEAFLKAKEEGLVDVNVLKRYALAMGSNALVNRVGFMLEANGIDAADLYGSRSRRYVKLAGARVHNKRWMVA